jgi:putative aldouronate transport system permease protein
MEKNTCFLCKTQHYGLHKLFFWNIQNENRKDRMPWRKVIASKIDLSDGIMRFGNFMDRSMRIHCVQVHDPVRGRCPVRGHDLNDDMRSAPMERPRTRVPFSPISGLSRKGQWIGLARELVRNRAIYLMAVPAMLLLLVFNYVPLAGLVIAFKNFKAGDGIFGSAWAEPFYANFVVLLSSGQALRAIRNTLLLNALFISTGVLVEVSFALMLNEVKNRWFKRITQSVSFLPFFISWIVVGIFSYNLMNYEYGAINNLLAGFGLERIDFYADAALWPAILTIAVRWKSTGYGAVIYLATLSGIDPSYYEAAEIDGANHWQQVRFISLPMLMPTVIILTLLAIGRIMNADFGMFYAMVGDAPQVFPTTDVIDTFVYRGLRKTGDIGMSSATGFFQSILSFVLILSSNAIARRIDSDSALF